MRYEKRTLSLILLLSIILTLFSACGKEEQTELPEETEQAEVPGLREYNEALEYYNAEKEQINYEKAMDLFLASAEKNYLPALEKLGYMFENGLGTEPSPESAGAWFSAAAQRGSEIAVEYINGIGRLDEDAVSSLMPAAAVREYEEGMLSFYGVTEQQDFSAAFEHFKNSAELGNGRGYFGLGVCYLHGKGTEKDKIKAAENFEKSAELGCIDAYDKLIYLCDGSDGDVIREEALKKWRERRMQVLISAAEFGYPDYLIEAAETALADSDEQQASELYKKYFDIYQENEKLDAGEIELSQAVWHLTQDYFNGVLSNLDSSHSDAKDSDFENLTPGEDAAVQETALPEENIPEENEEHLESKTPLTVSGHRTEAKKLLSDAAECGNIYAEHLLYILQLEESEDAIEEEAEKLCLNDPDITVTVNMNYWLCLRDKDGNFRIKMVYIPACENGETTKINDRFTDETLYEIKLSRKQYVSELKNCITAQAPQMTEFSIIDLYSLDNCLRLYEAAGVPDIFRLSSQFGPYAGYMNGCHENGGFLITVGELAEMYIRLLPEKFRQ